MLRLSLCLVMAVPILTSGCQSFSSSMLNRSEDNSLFGNSNGSPLWHQSTRPYKGIPITLKVPSHLDLYIRETYYVNVCGEDAVEPLYGHCRILNVDAQVIKTEKVFLVDFKRPGAGSLDLTLDFNEDQFFDKVDSKLVDETITRSAALAASTIKALKAFKTSTGPSPTDLTALQARGLFRYERVVAYQRFDLNSPDYEMQVEAFVNCHLNECHKCGSQPSYDDLNAPYPSQPACSMKVSKPETPSAPAASAAPTAGKPADADGSYKGNVKLRLSDKPGEAAPATRVIDGTFDFELNKKPNTPATPPAAPPAAAK